MMNEMELGRLATVAFFAKHPGWHSIQSDPETQQVAKSLVVAGFLESNEHEQYRYTGNTFVNTSYPDVFMMNGLTWIRTRWDDIFHIANQGNYVWLDTKTMEILEQGDVDKCKERSARNFYASEHQTRLSEFNHEECIEEIHRIYGEDIARKMDAEISSDIPEVHPAYPENRKTT